MTSQKKIAIIVTDTPNPTHAPKFGDFGDQAIVLFQTALVNHGDSSEYIFEKFDAITHHLPALSSINEYHGIYIAGSKFDSFDDSIEWIASFKPWIKGALDLGGKFVGICFGHQILSYSFGAHVERSGVPWEGGITALTTNEVGKKLFGRDKINLVEAHNDIVIGIPKGCEIWGYSEKAKNQGYFKESCVLTFQGHPEFCTEVSKLYVEEYYEKGSIDGDTYEEYKKNNSTLENDGVFIAGKILDFWNGDLKL